MLFLLVNLCICAIKKVTTPQVTSRNFKGFACGACNENVLDTFKMAPLCSHAPPLYLNDCVGPEIICVPSVLHYLPI